MTRSNWLGTAAAAAAVATVMAAAGCSPSVYSPRLGQLGVEGNEVVFLLPPVNVAKKDADQVRSIAVRRIEQEKADWCWAACAQMIHEYHGREITQGQLASLIHGEDVRTATYREIMIALCPDHTAPELAALRDMVREIDWMNAEVEPARFLTNLNQHYAATSDDIVEAMIQGLPVMVVLDETPDDALRDDFVFEHGYVVRGVGYVQTSAVLGAINKAAGTVRDWLPAGDHGAGHRLLNAAKAINFDYAIAWVELIDPDMAAVEDGETDEEDGPRRPRAIRKMPAEEFASRVNLILTPNRAKALFDSQGTYGSRAGGW